MKITEIFNLGTKGHEELDFIDIDEISDTKLFIDPYVIQALSNSFCLEAQKSIETFFNEVFTACKEQNHSRLRYLLSFASEPNETNLGMKSSSIFDKGTTSDELTNLFSNFYDTVRKNPHIESNSLAMCMYIPNFAEDKMSDLITNIIRKKLYEFTLEQANKWNIALGNKDTIIGYYWDYISLSWKKLIGRPFLVNNTIRLLVPKAIVRKHYVFNVECYIKQYILKDIQEDIIKNHPEKCLRKEYKNGKRELLPPTRKELYPNFVDGRSHKECALNYTANNKKCSDNFIKDILSKIRHGYGSLDDNQLDMIVYQKNGGNFYDSSY